MPLTSLPVVPVWYPQPSTWCTFTLPQVPSIGTHTFTLTDGKVTATATGRVDPSSAGRFLITVYYAPQNGCPVITAVQ